MLRVACCPSPFLSGLLPPTNALCFLEAAAAVLVLVHVTFASRPHLSPPPAIGACMHEWCHHAEAQHCALASLYTWLATRPPPSPFIRRYQGPMFLLQRGRARLLPAAAAASLPRSRTPRLFFTPSAYGLPRGFSPPPPHFLPSESINSGHLQCARAFGASLALIPAVLSCTAIVQAGSGQQPTRAPWHCFLFSTFIARLW